MKRAVLSVERPVISVSTLTGDKVRNDRNEDLGKIHDLMIDVEHGRIAYAVLSFGGIMGMGDKLFAIPWSSLRVDRENECMVLDVPKERLEAAPGFSKDDWPDMADFRWGGSIYEYYEQEPYWTVGEGPRRRAS